MKKNPKLKIITISALCLSLLCLPSCATATEQPVDTAITDNIKYDAYEEKISYCLSQIASLEEQLSQKSEELYISQSKYQLEISALQTTIASLQNQMNASDNNSSPTIDNNPETNEFKTDDFAYTVENNKVVITKYTGNKTEVEIPQQLNRLPVECIGEGAFEGTAVKSVILPEGVKKIDWFAFRACTALLEITIPASVKTIEYGAFDHARKSFVIKTSADSFAWKYAQSWGYISVIS